jgi:hypothetical protein
LNPPTDQEVWYFFDKEDYTDFPRYAEEWGRLNSKKNVSPSPALGEGRKTGRP